MSLDALTAALPPYANDLALNLGSLVEETLLSDQQKWGCFVASAHALGVPPAVKAIEAAAAASGLTPAAKTAAKAAAAIMAQNNVYFRAKKNHNLAYRSCTGDNQKNRGQENQRQGNANPFANESGFAACPRENR